VERAEIAQISKEPSSASEQYARQCSLPSVRQVARALWTYSVPPRCLRAVQCVCSACARRVDAAASALPVCVAERSDLEQQWPVLRVDGLGDILRLEVQTGILRGGCCANVSRALLAALFALLLLLHVTHGCRERGSVQATWNPAGSSTRLKQRNRQRQSCVQSDKDSLKAEPHTEQGTQTGGSRHSNRRLHHTHEEPFRTVVCPM